MYTKSCLFFLLLTLLVAEARSQPSEQPAARRYNDTAFISAILQKHNSYRLALQLPPLAWSPELAEDARTWGLHLAKIGKGEHDGSIRGREGENLWWGTTERFALENMVAFWGNESSNFQYGEFPDCSVKVGAVVGHYTQVVWKNTTLVGCALTSDGKTDFLVCRYSPPGNIMGQKPY